MFLSKLQTAAVLLATVAGGVGVLFLAADDPKPTAEAPAKKSVPFAGGLLEKDEPQPVYAADASDPWNRIFYSLFTRTLRVRLSDDFPEGKPFDPPERIDDEGRRHMPVSTKLFDRIEGGDRAIEPLDPGTPLFGGTSRTDGAYRAMAEPTFTQLRKALDDALQDATPRTPLARALMQADAWAAFDALSRNYDFDGDEGKKRRERRDALVPRFARLVKKLALSAAEVKALPDNFAAAVARKQAPDLFAADGPWLEVRWHEDRLHDRFADYRRVARVFVKPRTPPKDTAAFLNSLRSAQDSPDIVAAVALVTQNMLVTSAGRVVPSPLTFEVQVRTFVKDVGGKYKGESRQLDLSRQRLLAAPADGGLVEADDRTSFYFPQAGNDYSFTPHNSKPLPPEPVLIRLATRCAHCHGETGMMTFNVHGDANPPPVIQLKPSENEQSRFVIGRKIEREDFKALLAAWK